MNLTETHIAALEDAAADRSGLLKRPPQLKGITVKTFALKLLRLGLVEDVAVSDDGSIWWIDENGLPQGLRITAKARKYLDSDTVIAPDVSQSPLLDVIEQVAITEPGASTPRRGTKLDLIIDLMSHPDGASIDDLLTATGWLPHSLRAALSRLVKRGVPIERSAPRGNQARLRMRPNQ